MNDYMCWTVKFDERAYKEFKKLGRQIQKDILDYLTIRIASNENPRKFGKALSRDMQGLWRYRVRDYRIVCQITDHELLVLIIKIGHRKNVYCDLQ